MDLDLHRVSDPRFMAVDVPLAVPPGTRRLVCGVDASPEEIMAQCTLETGQRDRVLAGFWVESAWRSEHRGAGEPGVRFGLGQRADIEVRADTAWRPSDPQPDAAIVHAVLDASGVDEAHLRWLLGDGECTFAFLVTPPETARHLPEQIEHRGRTVKVRCHPWIRPLDRGGFDPLASAVWFELAGPNLALRAPVQALEPASFRKGP